MIDLPSWAAMALEVFYYAVFWPPLVLLAVFAVGFMIASVAYPIWIAFRGRDEYGHMPFLVRVALGVAGGLALLAVAAPWL